MAIPVVQTDTSIGPVYFVNQQQNTNGFVRPNTNTTNRATGNIVLPIFGNDNTDGTDDKNIVQDVNNPVDTSTNIFTSAALGVGALGLAFLPKLINHLIARKELNTDEIKYLDSIINGGAPMSKAEAQKFYERSKNVFNELLQPDATDKLREKPFVKYLLKSYTTNKAQEEHFLNNLRKYMTLNAIAVMSYSQIQNDDDGDGTDEPKDFANVASKAEQMKDDRERAMMMFYMPLKNKERGLLHLNFDTNDIQVDKYLQQAVDAGILQISPANKAIVKKFIQASIQNEKELYHQPSPEYLEYLRDITPNFNGVTARIGAQTTLSMRGVAGNPFFNKDIGYVEDSFASFPAITGTGNASEHRWNTELMNVYGMTGAVVLDGRMVINPGLVNGLKHGLQQRLEKAKFPEILAKLDPRILELKGLITGYTQGVLSHVYYNEYNKLGADEQAKIKNILDTELKKAGVEPESLSKKEYNEKLGYTWYLGEVAKGREPSWIPKAWEDNIHTTLARYLSNAHEREFKDKDVQLTYQKILERVRPIEDKDAKLILGSTNIGKQNGEELTVVPNNKLLKEVRDINRNVQGGDAKIPVAPELYEEIKKGATAADLRGITEKTSTSNMAVTTLHALDAEVRRVFTHDLPEFDPKTGYGIQTKRVGPSEGLPKELLESGKLVILSAMIKAHENPEIIKLLKSMDLDVLVKVEMGPFTLNKGKKALFTIVNNSGGKDVGTYIGDKNIKDIQGVKFIPEPFAAYLEMSLVELNKSGVQYPYRYWNFMRVMAGDSPGSDATAIAQGSLARLAGTGVVNRNLTDQDKIKDNIFALGDINHKVHKKALEQQVKLIKEAYYSQGKELPADITKHKDYKNLWDQIHYSPLMYQAIYRGEGENGTDLDAVTEYKKREKAEILKTFGNREDVKELKDYKQQLELIKEKYGQELEDLQKAFSKQEEAKFQYKVVGRRADEWLGKNNLYYKNKTDLRKALSPIVNDWLLEKVVWTTDVNQHLGLKAFTNAHMHGVDDLLNSIGTSPNLSRAALEHLGLGDAIGSSLGATPGAVLNPKEWTKEMKFLKGKNAYNPIHKLILSSIPGYMQSVQAGGLLAAFAGVGIAGMTAYNFYNHEKEEAEELNPTSSTNNTNNSTSDNNARPVTNNSGHDFHVKFNSASQSTINSTGNNSILKSDSDKTQSNGNNDDSNNNQRNWGGLAISALNTGVFLQNLGWLVSTFHDGFPQPLSLIGAGTNIVSTFLPDQFKLPVFVLGTAINMAGWAAKQTHGDQSDVNTPYPEKENLEKIIKDTKWDGKRNGKFIWDDPKFMATRPNGEKVSIAHSMNPGFVNTYYRDMHYFRPYEKLRKVMPSFLASTVANTNMVARMNWDMLKDWRFAHDMLRPIARKEFTRGEKIVMPNTRSFLLALGAGVPVGAMGIASLVALFKGKDDLTKVKKPENKYVAGLSQEIKDKVNAAERAQAIADTIDKENDVHQGPMEFAANVSAIIPAGSLAIMSLVTRKAGWGTPYHVVPTGLNLQHRITPKFNGNMMLYGSLGSIFTTTLSALSTAGILPVHLSHILDPLYIGLQGITGIGQSRDNFERNFSASQTLHFFPTQGVLDHMEQIAEAKTKTFLGRTWYDWWHSTRKLRFLPDLNGIMPNKKK